jgi:hypothetical protein
MFQPDQVIGVILALAFMVSSLWLVLKFTKPLIAEHKILFLLVYITVVLVNSWFIDNVIAIHKSLLDEKENGLILQVMLSIVNFGLGYYAATAKKDKKEEEQDK